MRLGTVITWSELETGISHAAGFLDPLFTKTHG